MTEYNGVPPFVAGSDTSEAAARAVRDPNTLRAQVLALLVKRGERGATDEEIQAILAMPANTERPRRRELVLRRSVIDSGQRRRTMSGRMAVVWCVAQVAESVVA